MRTKSKAVAALTLSTLTLAAVAGPLSPVAGPVGPTMKTLTEVEPRTAINATNTPGDGNSVYVISQPGSYYLTGNLGVAASKNGIKITASHVTIDLGGFTVFGYAGSFDGITTAGTFQIGLTVRNGIVRTFGGDGIDFATASPTWPQAAVFEKLQVTDNGNNGVTANDGTFRDSVVQKNGDYGVRFDAEFMSTFSGSTATDNGDAGFSASLANVSDCSASQNGLSGISLTRGAVYNCVCADNTTGVFVGSGSVVGCEVLRSTTTGIFASGLVKDNHVTGNNAAAGSSGIQLNGGVTLVTGNHVSSYAVGINAIFTGNTITGNSLATNTKAMVAPAGNRVGALVTMAASGSINGNTGGGLGTSDPLANLVY